MVVSPNSTSGKITIELFSDNKEKQDKVIEWELEAFNQMQLQKVKVSKQKDKKHKINVQGW
jgi:hypothetical protein